MQIENALWTQKYRPSDFSDIKGQKDIVEKDKEYLRKSVETYQWLAKHFSHWIQIDCVDTEGEMRSREEIHGKIVGILNEKGII